MPAYDKRGAPGGAGIAQEIRHHGELAVTAVHHRRLAIHPHHHTDPPSRPVRRALSHRYGGGSVLRAHSSAACVHRDAGLSRL
ncbi:hypothetical protein GCM10022251_23590 [Phytohabitans flavus]|uniref:Uncharacterized protein n=1 Tax=Phytohabitans flavus TaxID=1076124 RepID=A0A6F8XRK7_9ACTN|nr:hypothetical protein Pflav_028600 [Phytohabitans flavus]